jgi:hypothetical protein
MARHRRYAKGTAINADMRGWFLESARFFQGAGAAHLCRSIQHAHEMFNVAGPRQNARSTWRNRTAHRSLRRRAPPVSAMKKFFDLIASGRVRRNSS